jgi:RsiW-degrading membrane proteinase PrsW (M82 family)
MLAVLGLLLALASPLLLLPIEKFFPYPHFIEEAAKLLIVGMILKEVKKGGILVLMAGLLFAISESILYLANIFALGDLMAFPRRLVLACGLHTGTLMLMYFLGQKNYLGLAAGFIGAIVIHYFFNLGVALL